MYNQKFVDSPIFNRRRTEWTKENIIKHVDDLFKNIEILDGFQYKGCEWEDTSKKDENEKKKNREELKRSIFSTLKVSIENPQGKLASYYIQFPDLFYNQFFYIGGFLKIPVFQLFDFPILYRENKTNDRKLLKLRTNVLSIGVDLDRSDDVILTQFFNKHVPIELLICSLHTREEFNQFIEEHSDTENEILNKIIEKTNNMYDLNLSEEQKCNLIGEIFLTKNSDKTKKGEQILFSLKVAYEVDHFTRRFFKTNSLVFELLNAIYEGPRSDTDLKYKRIRFLEYIFVPLIYKIYELIITLNKHRKDKYQIPQNVILEACNYTDGKDTRTAIANIVHYNFPINPVGEIANLLQCSLVGPGGFKKDNVPPHLRDLDDSQFGFICTADTPDREGCGVVMNLVPCIDINEDGTFGTPNEEVTTSFPISLVPFLQNDDPTRLQMSSNQIKQSIMLLKTEKPLVRSGNEGIYLNETTFLKKAEHNGTVIYKDKDYLIISYDVDNCDKVEIFNIGYRSLYLNSSDNIKTTLNRGDKFRKGDVLLKSDFIKGDEISLGHNLLTAVMIFKGFNYEDGIVISDKVVDKLKSIHSVDLSYYIESGQVLLSLEDDKYRPLPTLNEPLIKGQTYAKIKNLDWEAGVHNVNLEPFEKKAPLDCIISSIKIFPNSWNKQIIEFNSEIDDLIDSQLSRYNSIVQVLSYYLDEIEIEKLLNVSGISALNCSKDQQGNFYNKGQKIGGIYLEVNGVYTESISTGDKLANRHGNKGVIAKVVPEDEMPVLEDGRHIEIIINPLGIISRMNPGQLFELHLGEALYQLKKRMKSLEYQEAFDLLKSFLYTLDESNNYWVASKILKEFDENFKNSSQTREDLNKAIDQLYFIAPPFESPSPEKLIDVMNLVGAKFEQNVKYSDVEVDHPVSVGYLYFHKLVHRSSDKIGARSIGPYNKKTSQPLGGKTNHGGHRLGEMEVWALLAHGSDVFLKDLLTIHSDSVGLKNQVITKILENPSLINEEEELETKPQSLKIMESYLNIVGIGIENGDLEENSLDIFKQEKYKR